MIDFYDNVRLTMYKCALPRRKQHDLQALERAPPSISDASFVLVKAERSGVEVSVIPHPSAEMDLHPHLHLLVPSVMAGVDLEVRLYMSPELLGKIPKSWTSISGLSSSASSNPVPAALLDQDTLAVLKSIDRLVIASHPWGRFGGNMLFPYVVL